MEDVTLKNGEPVSIKLMPAQVQIIIQALTEIPYRVAQPLLESIINQCKDQAEAGSNDPVA